MENPYLALSMPRELKEQIKAEAKARGLRPTEFVRAITVTYLDRHGLVRHEAQECVEETPTTK